MQNLRKQCVTGQHKGDEGGKTEKRSPCEQPCEPTKIDGLGDVKEVNTQHARIA
ncbi:MAG: hypothetical protein NPIRA02_20060 [Nitrospirales bacterium]|nr:MAG: hypothetical protein NPIRA02_20060 [Nitrospirales bacterium]